jgi:sugar phosphate isomerase/epimerase
MIGELDAFPAGWELLQKKRIYHCHVKNAVKGPNGKIAWSPVDKGFIDWTAQFRDLKKVGYAAPSAWRPTGMVPPLMRNLPASTGPA